MRMPSDSAWRAVLGEMSVGIVKCVRRPDARCFLVFDSCRSDAFAPLAEAVAAEMSGDLYVTVDEADEEAVRRFEDLGFVANRRESELVIPTDPNVTGLRPEEAPAEFTFVSADQVEERRLRALDDALRQDVPGTSGWRWDDKGFREETFVPAFDPATYLVAIEAATGEYAGLVRVWNNPTGPRLGLIGVLTPYRRRGLARALLARAFAVLDGRGKKEVSGEVDETNVASMSLIASLGSRRTGGTVELIRPNAPFV
jgi:ribosomal protein S18 acetylase RimI-like enzyme